MNWKRKNQNIPSVKPETNGKEILKNLAQVNFCEKSRLCLQNL